MYAVFHLANDTKSFAQFNQLTLTGRIFAAKVVNGENGEFLALTVISTVMNDVPMTFVFNDSKALLKFHLDGKLPVGRQITISGSLKGISEFYEKDGEAVIRKYPQVSLYNVSIVTGGWGPLPKKEGGVPTTKRIIKLKQAIAEGDVPAQETTEAPQVDEVPLY